MWQQITVLVWIFMGPAPAAPLPPAAVPRPAAPRPAAPDPDVPRPRFRADGPRTFPWVERDAERAFEELDRE